MKEKCVHHYIIEPDRAPTSQGVCKHCGLIRTFSNIARPKYNRTNKKLGARW